MDAGSRGEEVSRRLEAEGGSEVESEAENEAQAKGKAEGTSKAQGKDRKEESFCRKNGAAGREEESREEARGNEGSEEAINEEGGEAASLSTRCLQNKAADFGGLVRSPSRRVAESPSRSDPRAEADPRSCLTLRGGDHEVCDTLVGDHHLMDFIR